MQSREGSFCNPLALAALTDSPYGEGIQDSSEDFVAVPFLVATKARRSG
jgi:hypothetical protein